MKEEPKSFVDSLSLIRAPSLSRNLTASLLLLVFLIMAATILFVYIPQYYRLQKVAEDQAEEYASHLSQILALPVWTFDQKNINRIGSVFARNEMVSSIVITGEGGRVLFQLDKERVLPGQARKDKEIRHNGDLIGTVEVTLAVGMLRRGLLFHSTITAAAFVLLLLLILASTGFLVNRFLRRPLRVLEEGIDRVARGEMPHHTLQAMPYRELTHIAHRFTEMAEKVKSREEDLQRINRELEEEIVVRGNAEKAFERERERFFKVVEGSPFGMVMVDRKGAFVYMNPGFRTLFGYDLSDVPDGRTWFRKAYPDKAYRRTVIAVWLSDCALGRTEAHPARTFSVTCRDGSTKVVSFIVVPLESGEYLLTCRDITDIARAEEALRESEERFRLLAEEAPLGISLMREDLTTEYVNPGFTRIFGYTVEDVPDKATWFEKAYPDPAYRDAVIATWTDDVARCVNQGTVMEKTFTVRCKDGHDRIINFKAQFMANGKHFVIYEDITEKKRLESQFIEAQKMEAIGTLAGGIAHDFNNLLMGIQGYTSLMLLDTAQDHGHYGKLKSIEDLVKSGAELTRQILGFARGGRYQVKTVDLNEVVEKSSTMFGRTKREIRIHLKLSSRLKAVEVDRGQIEQALLNIYVNAWQAMPMGGDLYLQTENADLDSAFVHPYGEAAGSYVKISVTDTGVGMDEGTRKRIFEPFFTTKTMGRGTGLGLASVYGIVKGHHGIILCESEPGQGTTFTIYLPASDKVAEEEPEPIGHTFRGSGTILLVDDQEPIREVGAQLLASLGYAVLTAGSGEEAIHIYEKERERIDLVILDMIMPGLGGGETFNALQRIDGNVRVILSSGYSMDGQARQILDRGCVAFIQKPFTISQLSEILTTALKGPAST